MLQISKEGGSGKYLGLPENIGRRKRDVFTGIVDRIRQRSQIWSTRFLSPAGKHVMLQSVLSAMPSYSMTCFKLPQSLLDRIQSVLTRFWWDEKPDKRKISWVSWSKLATPKDLGGLGFRDLSAYNDSLLAKLSWRLLENPDSLCSRILLGKYCSNSSFLECEATSIMSHGWRGILIGRDVLKKGLGWIVGEGSNIRIWSDPWLSTTEPMKPMGPAPEQSANLLVTSLIDTHTKDWNWTEVRKHVPHHEDKIRFLKRSKYRQVDKIAWLGTKNGVYTFKSGYELLMRTKLIEEEYGFDWNKNVWYVKASPKAKMLLWKAKAGALPVGANLATRGLGIHQLCKRCNQVETVDHLFLKCQFAQKVWELVPIRMCTFSSSPDLTLFLKEATKFINLPPSGLLGTDLYVWIIWSLWRSRNKLIFENMCISEEDTINKGILDAKEWMLAQPLKKTPRQQDSSHPSLHSEPNQSGFRCFVDAAWRASDCSCGFGIVFRDHTDVITDQVAGSKRYMSSALEAETYAVLQAIKEAKRRSYAQVHVLSDCQVLINAIVKEEDRIEISNYLQDIKALRSEFTLISFKFVPRLANEVADSLAKKSSS